ncbi:uncharacterized protein LOC118199843 isoform X2 [Stegodyphus dumicola]|uniref:uncharacterized protein LOC118199843 isoform X2 n=1 Tax=Stegodyphus dumicola TaxID=202533 RepID=UPI0015B0109A|nr:uncharacterized protein LOC118199843 isoform X2 [Stegodyphus dumicola]
MTFSITAPLNQMAIPIFATPPSREHVGLDGELLFEHFVQEELEHEGFLNPIPMGVADPPANDLESDEVVQNERVVNGRLYAQGMRQRMEQPVPPTLAGVPVGFNNEHIISIGGNIRRLADEFSRSSARRSVMEQAEQERLFEKSYDVIIKIATVALAVTGVLCGIVYIKKNY